MDIQPTVSASGRVRLGSLEADFARTCLIGPDGSTVLLRPKTWEVLVYLLQNPRRVVSRAELLDAVWREVHVTDASITQCVVELRKAMGEAGAALLRTAPRRGYLLEVEDVAMPGPSVAADAGRPAASPVLAVLPLTNLSGDPRWNRLCDGLVEEMINDLTRHPDMRLIARTSSFAWRDRPADIRDIGHALGAGYLLEGSVQAEGPQVKVTAQLVDAGSGAHLWASRYLREAEGLFAIQAEVVSRVVGTLAGFAGAIARSQLARARRAPPASLHAYELYLLGYEQESRLDRDGTLRAIDLLEAAVAADPGLSRAWTVLGFAFANAAANGWTDDPAGMRERQRDAIRRAVALDPGDAIALEELGAMLARQGDLPGARDAFERAAEAGASHADALALLGKYMVEVLGHAGTAERMMRRAFELNPFAPAWYFLGATRIAYFAEDFARAAELALRAPALRLPRLFHLLALAKLDREAEARAALAAYHERFGPDAVAGALAGLPPLCAEARRLLDSGLRKAGLGS